MKQLLILFALLASLVISMHSYCMQNNISPHAQFLHELNTPQINKLIALLEQKSPDGLLQFALHACALFKEHKSKKVCKPMKKRITHHTKQQLKNKNIQKKIIISAIGLPSYKITMIESLMRALECKNLIELHNYCSQYCNNNCINELSFTQGTIEITYNREKHKFTITDKPLLSKKLYEEIISEYYTKMQNNSYIS